MAVGAVFLVAGSGEDVLVLVGIDFIFGMASEAEDVDFGFREHGVGGGAIAAGGPGFVGDVVVADSMTLGTTDPGPGVGAGQLFLHEVDMANLAATVVGAFGSNGVSCIVQEQQRFGLFFGCRFILGDSNLVGAVGIGDRAGRGVGGRVLCADAKRNQGCYAE